MIIFVLSFLCLSLLLALLNLFNKLWWKPNRLQHLLALQGIKGPSYRFLHGNAKEILIMQKEAMVMAKHKGLSNDTFPILQPHMYRWTKLYGRNYLQWLGSQAELVITEPEFAKEVLGDKDRIYTKAKASPFVKKLLGDGLPFSRGEKWAKMRKLANSAFHLESIKGMIPSMIESVESMLERWKSHEGKEIEVYGEFRLFTSEVISRTAFGSSYLEGVKIFEMLEKLSFLASRNMFKTRFPGINKLFKTKDQIESDKLEEGIRDSILELIKKREGKVKNEDEEGFGSDFLGLLVKAHHNANENQRISVDDVVDECKTFYFAGQETTMSLLAWAVYLLAVHIDWQEEARKEVINIFGKQIPNPDGLVKLKTMSMIINETLRLYPPVIMIKRIAQKKVRLGNLNLPANDVNFVVSSLALHLDPQIWGEDVLLFKPERFAEGVAKATKNNLAAFIPFAIGPRNCAGTNFAITESKIALAMILQRYSFTLSPAYVHSPVFVLTNRPLAGVQVKLQSI
ncbi:hypothetical protein UlMin_040980 [Ulmus minor]